MPGKGYKRSASRENSNAKKQYPDKTDNSFKTDNMTLKGLGFKNEHNVDMLASPALENEPEHEKCKPTERRTRRGYFDIITFYVQMSAAMKITIEFSDIDDSKSVLDYISDNIERFLNFAISDITIKFCPISDLSTRGKHISILAFLLAVYVTWCVVFTAVGTLWLCFRNNINSKHNKNLDSLRIRLIAGLVEIIKYTYEGFCEVIFLSLVCVDIKGTYVWFYDASQICLEQWQMGMLAFGAAFAVPFPLALFLSMRCLEQGKISCATFFICCICPVLGIPITCVCILYRKQSNVDIPSTDAILYVLQGQFRDDANHRTLYWEAIISVRHLLITGMILFPYSSIRMIVLSILCALFLIHHNYRMPFQIRTSNHVETLSLLFTAGICNFQFDESLADRLWIYSKRSHF